MTEQGLQLMAIFASLTCIYSLLWLLPKLERWITDGTRTRQP